MKRAWLLPLFLPALAFCREGGTCNFTGFYIRDTHVILSVISSGMPRDEAHKALTAGPCGTYSVEGNLIHRVFVDLSGQPYFGYDLQVTPNPTARTFRIEVVRPHPAFAVPTYIAGEPPRELHVDGNRLQSFSKFPAAITLADGDRVDVPVLENPATSVRLLDSYAIALRGTGVSTAPFRSQFPNLAPAGTILRVEQPHLWRDVSDFGENPQFGMSGPVVWVYSRFTGRFLFSATPRPGYRRLGVATGALIRFTDGVEQFGLRLHADAIDKPGAWWIWVKREPDFKPPLGMCTEKELLQGMLAIGADR
jgi:hypothetical protein